MTNFRAPSLGNSAVLEFGRSKLSYSLRTEEASVVCTRVLMQPDGSRIQIELPFRHSQILREFLDADAVVRPFRSRFANLLVQAQNLIGTSVYGESRGQSPKSAAQKMTDIEVILAAGEQLSAAQTIAAAHTVLLQVAQRIGLEGYWAASYAGNLAADRRVDLRCLVGVRPAWAQIFIERHWYVNSAILIEAWKADRPVFGSDVASTTDAQREIRRIAESFDVNTVVVFPRHFSLASGTPGYGVLGFLGGAAPDRGEAAARRYAVTLRGLAASFVDAWVEIERRREAGGLSLSHAEKRLLRGVEGRLKARELAQTLRVSETSVHNQYRRLNAKLGVASKHEALARAVELGLIFHETPAR